jgi:xylan 1,4-beta-xylosidase
MNIGQQLRAMDLGMRVVASFPEWKDTPIILGESDPEGCAACKGEKNGYRNGPLYGASVAEAVARAVELSKRNGVKLQGAVTWAFEFEDQPLFAGFRELATGGKANGKNFLVDKAVLNVFRMMGMMSGQYVSVSNSGALPLEEVLSGSVRTNADLGAVATRSEHKLEVLLWNYHDDDVAAEPTRIELSINGLPVHRALKVKEYLMDASHSNAYAEWKKMGSPSEPTEEQFRRLQSAAKLQGGPLTSSTSSISDKDHIVELPITLARQGVTLVEVAW